MTTWLKEFSDFFIRNTVEMRDITSMGDTAVMDTDVAFKRQHLHPLRMSQRDVIMKSPLKPCDLDT